MKEKFIGQKIRCSNCGADLTVPSENETAIPQPDLPTNFHPLKPQVTQQDAQASAPASLSKSISSQPPQQPPRPPQQPQYQPPQYQPVEEEYYIIGNNAPELLSDYAVQAPEDSGPPSEALSVILGRAAVQEHMLNIGDTMGVHPTPVPVAGPTRKKSRGTAGSGPEAQSVLGLNTDEPQRPIMDHGVQKSNSNPIVYILIAVIVVLVLAIVALVFTMSGGSNTQNVNSLSSGLKFEA